MPGAERMRSLSKVFKDSDIVIENYYLMLDSIINNENMQAPLRTLPPEPSLGKREEVLWQAKLKAHQLIKNGMECANNIILDAKQKAREELETARKNGYEEGYLTGQQKGEQMVQAGLQELQALLCSIEKAKAEYFAQYEEQLKELALGIAKKVIDSELKNDSSRFLSIYQNAVKQSGKPEWVKLVVAEQEAEFATASASLLMSLTEDTKDLQVIVSGEASPGTCVVETPSSVIDASVDTQLSQLREVLFQNKMNP